MTDSRANSQPDPLVSFSPPVRTWFQELTWVGSGGVDPRRGRIRFLFRGEGQIYLEPKPAETELAALSEPARTVYQFLKSEGALFLADMQAGLELDSPAVETALIELVMAGLVTNDSLETMRQVVQGSGSRTPASGQTRRPFSSLETQLAERRSDRPRRRGRSRGVGRPSPAAYRAAKRRVRERLAAEGPADPHPDQALREGRWTLVHRFGVMGKAVSVEEQVARQARQLLARYGVVTRHSLAGEIGPWNWGLIYQQLQRLEMRGEIRRGYFVQGLPGIQFALPEVVEQLRAVRNGDGPEPEALVVMNAADPANLYGPALEVELPTAAGAPLTFSRIPSTWLVQQRGLPVLLAEDTGSNLTAMPGVNTAILKQAVAGLLSHLAHIEHRITVKSWNGDPILDSAGQALLEALDFYRDYPGMTWEKSFR